MPNFARHRSPRNAIASIGALIGCAFAAVAFAASSASAGAEPSRDGASERTERILVFTRTAGFVHDSIPEGVALFEELGRKHSFRVDSTDEASAFRLGNLRRYDAVVFLSTTGDVLDRSGQSALRRYMRSGGGWMGIHSASDTEYDWPFYGQLVGAYFKSHPLLQQDAVLVNEAPRNPATRHLRDQLTVFDEHYSFSSSPRQNVRVLLSLDESAGFEADPNTTILGGNPTTGFMGDHPMAWCHRNVGGPAFYTATGHVAELYSTRWYAKHLYGGLKIATREVDPPCRPVPQPG